MTTIHVNIVDCPLLVSPSTLSDTMAVSTIRHWQHKCILFYLVSFRFWCRCIWSNWWMAKNRDDLKLKTSKNPLLHWMIFHCGCKILLSVDAFSILKTADKNELNKHKRFKPTITISWNLCTYGRGVQYILIERRGPVSDQERGWERREMRATERKKM